MRLRDARPEQGGCAVELPEAWPEKYWIENEREGGGASGKGGHGRAATTRRRCDRALVTLLGFGGGGVPTDAPSLPSRRVSAHPDRRGHPHHPATRGVGWGGALNIFLPGSIVSIIRLSSPAAGPPASEYRPCQQRRLLAGSSTTPIVTTDGTAAQRGRGRTRADGEDGAIAAADGHRGGVAGPDGPAHGKETHAKRFAVAVTVNDSERNDDNQENSNDMIVTTTRSQTAIDEVLGDLSDLCIKIS